MITLFLIISELAMLGVVIAAFWPLRVKPMVDAFRKATRKELEYEKGKPFGALDPEEALHMALQWRFRRDALLLGFASMILVCTTIIIVNRTQACAGGTSTKKSQESQVAPLINQPFNWDLTTNTTSAPQ